MGSVCSPISITRLTTKGLGLRNFDALRCRHSGKRFVVYKVCAERKRSQQMGPSMRLLIWQINLTSSNSETNLRDFNATPEHQRTTPNGPISLCAMSRATLRLSPHDAQIIHAFGILLTFGRRGGAHQKFEISYWMH